VIQGVGENYIAELLVVGTLVVIGAVATWFRAMKRRQTSAADDAEERTSRSRIETLREQVIDVARARGIKVAERSQGWNPVMVTYVDGKRSWFYRDRPSYINGLTTRRSDPTRSYCEIEPPEQVSAWREQRLEEWLADHAD
jgi:hypothetical protein